jgi:LCP family protein required for cell wall assembly
MKSNKSIDGLSTRAAKKNTAPNKKNNQPLTIAVEDSSEVIHKDSSKIIEEESLQIDVIPDDEKHQQQTTSDTSDILSREQAIEDFLTPVQALNLDEKPTKKTKKSQKSAKKEKKKPKKARRIITTISLVIVLFLIGFISWAVLWGNDIIAKITGGQGNVFDLLTFVEDTYEPLKTDTNGRTNILAFGTSGYDMEGNEGNGVHDGAQLTDSIMVISLNQETGDVAMLSLPRDLKASPTCTATGKINEVYWCNNMDGLDENAGATALMTEVGSILGIDFQYYAHLNWGSLVSIVDTLGGIKVTLDEDIEDYYWTGAVYQAGIEYTLNGEEALGLARARHGTSGGDFSRGASQQKILIGIKDRIFEKELSLTDIINLASTLGDNLRTNLTVSEIKTAAHLTFNFDFENMRQLSLYPDYMTTGTINGISYVLPKSGVGNYGEIQDYVAKMLSNDPRTYEDATILVLNATEELGLAASEREALLSEGYNNIDIDDAPEGEYQQGYTLYAISDTKTGTKNLLETYYNTTSNSVSELPAGISQDYDFVIVINKTTSTEDD